MFGLFRSFYRYLVVSRCKTHGNNIKVNGRSYVNDRTVLGDNINFNGMYVKGRGEVYIGNNFHSGKDCVMLTDIHNYDYGEAIPYDSSTILGKILIEDNVWLGDRVMILMNVKIGEGAIIQAGSVVVNDIPSYAIAGGHPAKVFKFRNIEHYQRLKQEGKFH